MFFYIVYNNITRTIFNWSGKIATVSLGTVFVLILSAMKELIMDDKADWKDILASVLGCVPVFVAVAIGVLFNYLSM